MTERFPYLPLGPLPAGQQDHRRFRTWAPTPASVELVVLTDGREQRYAMHDEQHGYRTSDEVRAPAGSRYGYYLDGDRKKRYPDPASRYQPEGVHGWSEVIDLEPLPDTGWRGHSLAEAVIYELHIGTFTPEGTLRAAIGKLDYLRDLGVNTLEVMPLNQTPGDRNWGYDGVKNFALFKAYGRPEDLRAFIDAAHERGIAVLIDVIYNHLGPEGNYLPEFFPVFTEKHHTPWGQAINFDDSQSDGVRNYWLQNVRMWLEEYGADGLRIDAVHAIKDYSATHFLEELATVVDEIGERQGRQMITIAECDLNAPRFIRSRADGGYGMSGQWVDEFHHALHVVLTGETRGYYEDFGSVETLAKALHDGYVYTGQYSRHRGRNFGVEADERVRPAQMVVFLQNHDQVGNRMIGDRILSSVGTDKYLLGAATYLLSPFTPLLFMGEEYGEQNPFPYFVHHGDDWLIEAVRKGRAAEFAAFQHEGHTVPDPQSEKTFASAKLSWEKDEKIARFYREALHLRAGAPKDFAFTDITVDHAGCLITWTVKGSPFLCCANFGDGALDIEVAGELLLQSNGATLAGERLHLPAWGFAAVGNS
ncbi:maltooligosyl trehalose hydrolase [Neolewinella xylanilytica]|uniref:Malto-oligosyltrehalose trehalohydrolase n=1 Tax=Neolewinella xylanilytica TaxID=1514080 RepID=A0A2S6IBI9_9BACT|nr:malto-oligosyltrehalose trehalohydrolase [Neolewinella xylanilytica]PPK88832.1 maltooligosyl trehalose hydrolase [Neolewinella xylanilytica]